MLVIIRVEAGDRERQTAEALDSEQHSTESTCIHSREVLEDRELYLDLRTAPI